MSIARFDDTLSRLPMEDSDRGMIFRVVLIGGICAIIGSGLYFATAQAQSEKVAPNKLDNSTSMPDLEREIVLLRREVSSLRADNESLQTEIATLTAQNGVVDRIIERLRELKAQDQAILELVQPSSNNYALDGDASRSISSETAYQSTARHQIVTPKAKAPPVPSPRPEKVADADAGKPAAAE